MLTLTQPLGPWPPLWCGGWYDAVVALLRITRLLDHRPATEAGVGFALSRCRRKEYEERAKKNAQARQERNGTGQQPQPKAASSFFSSKPSVSATKKLWVNHESAWEAFDANPPPAISYAKVPWPPDAEDVLRGMVSASYAPAPPSLSPSPVSVPPVG